MALPDFNIVLNSARKIVARKLPQDRASLFSCINCTD
jgi:hypothetical protein